jgi:hypothetical protein
VRVLRQSPLLLLALLFSFSGGCTDLDVPTEPSPAGCTFALSSEMRLFDSDRGAGTVSVRAPAGCAWTTVTTADWITVESGERGEGNGTIAFSIDANCGTHLRSAAIVVASQVMRIVQTPPEEERSGVGCGLVAVQVRRPTTTAR